MTIDMAIYNSMKFYKSPVRYKLEIEVIKLLQKIFGDFPSYTKVFTKLKLSELLKIPEYEDALKGPTLCFHDIQGFTVNAEDVSARRF